MHLEDTLVQVNNLAKKFCRDPKKSLRYGWRDIGRDLLGKPSGQLRDDEFWALKDVSMRISRGDSIGIIGNNGAGKSTLLKLLAGILKPDHGTIAVNGKLVALLEIGAGFNSLLTGRENIYINGTFAGMRTKEINLICDEIIDFAELDEFIDSPLRTYSTGMRSRLGFAMAVASKPDIMLLDETLVVGDISFQSKCEKEIQRLRNNGSGFIIVSQSMHSTMRTTQRCVWLENGEIVSSGKTNKICLSYINRQLDRGKATYEDKALKKKLLISEHINNLKVRLIDTNHKSIISIHTSQKMWVDFEYLTTINPSTMTVHFDISSRKETFAKNLAAPFQIISTKTEGGKKIKGRLLLKEIPKEKRTYTLRIKICHQDKLIHYSPEAHFFIVENANRLVRSRQA